MVVIHPTTVDTSTHVLKFPYYLHTNNKKAFAGTWLEFDILLKWFTIDIIIIVNFDVFPEAFDK